MHQELWERTWHIFKFKKSKNYIKLFLTTKWLASHMRLSTKKAHVGPEPLPSQFCFQRHVVLWAEEFSQAFYCIFTTHDLCLFLCSRKGRSNHYLVRVVDQCFWVFIGIHNSILRIAYDTTGYKQVPVAFYLFSCFCCLFGPSLKLRCYFVDIFDYTCGCLSHSKSWDMIEKA